MGFSRLAREHSEDQATRYAGGDTGWLIKSEANSRWETPVMEAAFSITRPGEVAPLVTTATGFYLVRLTGKKTATIRPLAEVSDAIQYQLTRRKQEQAELDFIGAMKAGLKIEVDYSILKSVAAPVAQGVDNPPPMPSGDERKL
jgi:foldase protein PrsA